MSQETPTLLTVESLTDEQYLNLQRLMYSNGVEWVRATRNPDTALERELRPTVVHVLVRNERGEGLFTREFRYPVNGWVLGVPAGLIDPGESPVEAARRELREEVGLDVPLGQFSAPPEMIYLASAGLTDECTQGVVVDLEGDWRGYVVGAEPEEAELIEWGWWGGGSGGRPAGVMSVGALLLLGRL